MTDELRPGVIGPSPSERGLPAVPADPAEHAVDFSRRYADDLEIATGEVMIDLGLTQHEMGLRDPDRNREHHTFFPNERDCGGITQKGQINLDSGVMNLSAMDRPYGEECGKLWRKSKLRARMQAIIAHEKSEYEHNGDHELALIAAPETDLPISKRAKEILRAKESGWKGYSR
jgi:hypothetical protein